MAKVTTYTVATFSLVMTEDEASRLLTMIEQESEDSMVDDIGSLLRKSLDKVKETKKELEDRNVRV
jgi:hypothetical protein